MSADPGAAAGEVRLAFTRGYSPASHETSNFPDDGVHQYQYRLHASPLPAWGTAWTDVPSGGVVTGLTSAARYQFRVRTRHTFAGNSVATSAVSVHACCASPPRSFDAAAGDGYGEILLTWAAPASGTVTKYEYRYKRSDAGAWPATGAGAWADVPDSGDAGSSPADETSYRIQNLLRGVGYNVQLRAVTSVGNSSVVGGATTVTTREVPTPSFSAAPGSAFGTVTLTWATIPPGPLGVAFTYEFRYKKTADADYPATGAGSWADAGVSPKTVTGLDQATGYDVQMRSKQSGNVSDAVAATVATRAGAGPGKGLALVPSDHLAVTAGSSASYTAALTSKPTGTVTVSVTSDNADVTVSPDSLTFDATNWSTAQPVTVTATADDDDLADTAKLSHVARGGGYNLTRTLWAAVAGGGARIASAGPRTGSVYVVNGHRVTVTESSGVPAGVEIDLPSDLDEAVSVTFKRVGDGVRRESGSFRLEHDGARAMVDVSVMPMPMPDEAVRLCLAPPAGMRDAARRVSGRGVKLLRYTDGSWTAVTNLDSDWDESRSRVCATVEKTSPFAAGYANMKPKFDTTQKDLMFTVDEEIDPPVTLPAATGGDGTLRYALTPALPRGVKRSGRRLSGTPTEESKPVTYTWTATDADNETVPLTFDIEVKPALAEARARLKAINESVLPELSRALWGSALDAVTGRLESPDAAPPTAAGGLEAAATFARANESALEEGDVSWKELLGAESFAFGLAGDGEGGAGIGGAVAWGSGDWQTRSRYEDLLDWSGGAFSAHAGVDAALRPDLRAGLAASWFSSDVDYTDRSQGEAIAGSHESRMMSLTPYLGWDVGDGTRLWGAAGYGWGKIEIVDADLRERFGAQKADSRFLAGAAGGSVPVWSRGPATLEAKGSAEATRWRVKDNGNAIAGVVVSTRRLRLAAVGSRGLCAGWRRDAHAVAGAGRALGRRRRRDGGGPGGRGRPVLDGPGAGPDGGGEGPRASRPQQQRGGGVGRVGVDAPGDGRGRVGPVVRVAAELGRVRERPGAAVGRGRGGAPGGRRRQRGAPGDGTGLRAPRVRRRRGDDPLCRVRSGARRRARPARRRPPRPGRRVRPGPRGRPQGKRRRHRARHRARPAHQVVERSVRAERP